MRYGPQVRLVRIKAFIGCVASAGLGATRVAAGAPLAQLDGDIDGDGKSDRVTVESNGRLTIEAADHSVFALSPALVRATVATATVRNAPTVLVVAATSSDEQSVVFSRSSAGWHEIVRDRTGPVGADGDYATALGLEPSGIVRYQTRAGLRRCDGKPAYLFAEGWNNQRFVRLSKVPTGVPATAPAIEVHLEVAPPPAPLLYQARFASHEPGASDAGALAPPVDINDGNINTFWQEGLANSAGEGQFFTFEPRVADARASRIRIAPGNPPPRSGQPLNRPRRIAVVGANGAWHVDLPDAATAPRGAAYVADLPTPIDGCVTIILESTYGPSTGTTAIAELSVFAAAERNGGAEHALARAIAAGSNEANSAPQALAQRGAAAVTALDHELRQTHDLHARHRLAHALIAMKSREAGPVLARAIANGSVDERDVHDATAALAAMGLTAELYALASRDELSVGARSFAARALATDERVMDLAGTGPLELRRVVVDAMSAFPAARLVAAVARATTPAANGDLWRAVTRRAAAIGPDRAVAIAAMVRALATANDYEVRYRLVAGSAAFGDADALRALQRYLNQLPQTPARAALEQVAARSLAQYPRPDARSLLLWLLREPDPGVRIAAIEATNAAAHESNRDDAAALAPAIEIALASDTWPEVRQRAAHALGTRCIQPGPAQALLGSYARDRNVGVRSAALAALVECKAVGTGDLLVRIWHDSALPVALRTKAIDLTATLADRATAVRLVEAFAQWQRTAAESAAALALAQAAAYAIGQLAPAGAALALERALDDSSPPEVVAAAVSGLGAMGPACPASAKSRLAALSNSNDQQIRVAAGRAVAHCGK